ncbi:FAD-binding oxidoreductase [Candidatus Bipolaricaulota bacterium]|nr:FAD-binding oxidoreductase [Candidatus Bipolaricaulota bacterium]
MIERNVVIIGGGSTGLAVGYYLEQLGVEDVTILEQNYAGSGATGRCGTGIRAQFSDEPTIKTMKRAEDLWEELAGELDFDFLRTGYLYLHHTEEALEKYREMKDLQNSLGVPTEILTPGEAKEICDPVDVSGLEGASYNPEDGKAHPFAVVAGFKRYFQSSRIELEEGTKVENIQSRGSEKVKVVETTGEDYRAEVLVNAAGGWAPKVAGMMGLDLPIEPYRHQAIITEPVHQGTIEPMVISMEHEDAYMTQTERGGIICGVGTPEDEPPTYNTAETLGFERRVSRAMGSIAPDLKHTRILRHWAGYYAMSPDGNPLIGEYGPAGCYLAAGFSGHGYMMAPAVGRGLAQIISRGETDFPFDYYDPARIDRGELREGALQMG